MNYLLPYNTSHNAYRLLDKELLQSIDKYEMEIIRENSKNAMRFNLGGKPVQLMKRLSSLQNIVKETIYKKPEISDHSELPAFTNYSDLACDTVGGAIIYATDDWFAPCENMIKADQALFKPEEFTEYGKQMDGWETRRKRIPGNDWCIVQLGCRGKVRGIEVSTHHFTGNYPPRCSIRGACLPEKLVPRIGDRIGTAAIEEETREIEKLNSQDWNELVPISLLKAGYKDTHRTFFEVDCDEKITHIRLDIYPDGGVARLRVHGEVIPDWTLVSPEERLDLVAMVNGGVCVDYTDAHYGHARNVIAPGRARRMDEGWETARRLDRPPILTQDLLQSHGGEWAIYRLGYPGCVEKVEIDTKHFKGNFPHSFILEGTYIDGYGENQLATENELKEAKWSKIVARHELQGHFQHKFSTDDAVQDCGTVNYVRLTILPDGGISRMILIGHIDNDLPRKSQLNYSFYSDTSKDGDLIA